MTNPALAYDTAHGRYYTHPASRDSVPSITNIINMKAKPLYGAGLRAAATYAAQQRATLATLDEEQAYKLVSDPPKPVDSPAVIGDYVHSWIDRYIQGEPPAHEEVKEAPQTAQWMFDRFRRFCMRFNPKFTASEFTVWSNRYGYAGTADWSAMIGGYHVLADSKTGKAAYAEVAMQVAAITNADFVLGPDGSESPIPKYDRYAVLHLRPRSYALYPIFRIDDAFQAFLGLKQVFDWSVNHAPYSIGDAPKISV